MKKLLYALFLVTASNSFSNYFQDCNSRLCDDFDTYITKNKVNDELQLLIDDLIDSLNVKELDANQRIKMLQIVLQYILPKMKYNAIEVNEDLPLFMEDL